MAVEAGGIGARLRAGREKLGLTVLQVAERMHTDPKIVEAIETESFEVLGAPVYARGHIRHYADLVGESANELTQMYSNLSKVAQPDLTRIVKAPARPESSKLVAPALVVISVFAVAGAIWWISALSKKKPQMSETHVVTDEVPAPVSPDASAAAGGAPAAADGATAAADVAGTSTVGGAPTSSGDRGPPNAMSMQPRPAATGRPALAALSTRVPSPTTPAPSTATRSAPTRTASATPARPPSPGAAVAPASAPEPVTAPRAKAQSSVTLRYSADSWTEVYDASGARLFYDVGAANSVQTVVGTPPLRVVLGNASGVSVEYNGHSKPIAKLSRPDGSVQFSITRSGEVVRAKPVADGG
jgi:cytoskeleton protein RodZ